MAEETAAAKPLAVLVHDAAAPRGDLASQDVLQQMTAVEEVLRNLGYGATRLPMDLDLRRFKNRLRAVHPALVFNLVESLDGSDRLQTLLPLLLEDWRIPFTGCGSASMLLANDKIGSKRTLAGCGLSFPACVWQENGALRILPEPIRITGSWIVKTRDSHASLFLDDDSVIADATADSLIAKLNAAEEKHGCPFFAEQFIDGREFNLSVVENRGGEARVLPAAEILFDDLPPDKPRIVGYSAKWEEESPEYQGTVRSFPAAPDDVELIADLTDIAREVWSAFALGGYARVDFRVDAAKRPFILEANANPCLSPDAGLAAAAKQDGLGYRDLIAGIVESALRRTL